MLGQPQSLYQYLTAQPSEGTYSLEVIADPRHGRVAREALLSVSCAKVEIQRPETFKNNEYPPSISLYALYAVEAKEVNPPSGQKPVHWQLMTTHRVV